MSEWYHENKEHCLEYARKYYENNMDARRDYGRKYSAKYRASHGGKPMSENKSCAAYLGCHIAERVLSKVFKDVEVMPPNHPGYDFICNKGKKIDVKSSCTTILRDKYKCWRFRINRNNDADYFLCIAFDNRKELNPLYLWLLPSDKVNHLLNASVYGSKIDKWDEYKLDVNRLIKCCDKIKEE